MSNLFFFYFSVSDRNRLSSDPAGVDLNLQSWLSDQTSEKRNMGEGGRRGSWGGGLAT